MSDKAEYKFRAFPVCISWDTIQVEINALIDNLDGDWRLFNVGRVGDEVVAVLELLPEKPVEVIVVG